MKFAKDVDFLTIALYLAIVAMIVYAIMIFAVRRKVFFRSPLEMHFPRLWREHEQHFPTSRLRMVLMMLLFAVVVCAVLEAFLR